MGAGFSIKPMGTSVVATYTEAASDAAKAAVPTQLAPDKSIIAPDASVQARNNPQAETDRLSRQVAIDRATAEIAYRTAGNRTSLVVLPYPTESRLRARAYLRAMDMARKDKMRRHTDLQV